MKAFIFNVLESGALWALLMVGLQVAGLIALFNLDRLYRWSERRKARRL